MTLFILFSVAILIVGIILSVNDGFWGVDAGIKTLAAVCVSQQGIFNYSLPETLGEIDPGGLYLPYRSPFVTQVNNRLIPVYNPLFIWLGSLAWDAAGEYGIRFLSLLGSILILIFIPFMAIKTGQFSSQTISPSIPWFISLSLILSTPLLFYTFAIWEHSLFTASAVFAALSRLHSKKWFYLVLSGLLAATGIALRPEGLFWAILLIFLSKRGAIIYFVGLITGILLYGFLNLQATGYIVPLQWTANIGFYQLSTESLLNSLIVLLGKSDAGYGLLWLTGLVLLLFFSSRGSNKYTIPGIFAISVIYLGIWIYHLINPVPLGLLARSSGLLAVAPLAALWWFIPLNKNNDNLLAGKEKNLKILVSVFIVLAVFTNPVPDGIHYGPRVLLPAIVLAVAGTLFSFYKMDKPRKALVVSLLILSVLFQLSTLQVLHKQRLDNGQMRIVVREHVENEPLLLSAWYFGSDLGPELIDKTVLLPRTQKDWAGIIDRIEEYGYKSFWILHAPGMDLKNVIGKDIRISNKGKYAGGYWELTRCYSTDNESSISTPSARSADFTSSDPG